MIGNPYLARPFFNTQMMSNGVTIQRPASPYPTYPAVYRPSAPAMVPVPVPVPYYQPVQPSITWIPVIRNAPPPPAETPVKFPVDTTTRPAATELMVPEETSVPSPVEIAPEPVDTNFTEVKARHILFEVSENADEAEKEAVRQQITALRNDIVAGKYTFEEAAREFSEGPSSVTGGDLGYFGEGMMVKPFERVAFDPTLSIGDISEPVLTQFGWHLIYIEDRR